MAANTRAFPNQLDRDIVERFFDDYIEYPAEYTQLAKVVSHVGKGRGDHITKSFLSPLGGFNLTPQGNPVSYDTPVEGDKKSLYFDKWTLGFQITEEMKDDSLDDNFDVMPSKLSKSAKYKQDASWWDLFNNGFATHTAADGQYLFHATAHTALKSGTIIVTRPATDVDLGETGLQAALEDIAQIKDESGNPIRMNPKWLVVPTESQWVAQNLYLATNKIGSMDNDINTVKPGNMFYGGWKPFVSLWITDTDSWGVFCEGHDFEFVWRWPLKLQSSEDFNTGSMLYKASMRYKCGVWDYRGAWATTGA